MKNKIVVRRRVFGFLVTVAEFPAYKYESRISTHGVLVIHPIGKPNGSEIWAFAVGEWHTCEPLES